MKKIIMKKWIDFKLNEEELSEKQAWWKRIGLAWGSRETQTENILKDIRRGPVNIFSTKKKETFEDDEITAYKQKKEWTGELKRKY